MDIKQEFHQEPLETHLAHWLKQTTQLGLLKILNGREIVVDTKNIDHLRMLWLDAQNQVRPRRRRAHTFRCGVGASAVRPFDGAEAQVLLGGGASLVVDVVGDGVQGCSACGSDVVAAGPEVVSPKVFADTVGVGVSESSGGRTFEGVHEFGELHGRWEVDEQVDVIVLPVEGDEFASELRTGVCHRCFTVFEEFVGEHSAPVFRDEYQMGVTGKDTVTAGANILRVSHTPSLADGRMNSARAPRLEGPRVPDCR